MPEIDGDLSSDIMSPRPREQLFRVFGEQRVTGDVYAAGLEGTLWTAARRTRCERLMPPDGDVGTALFLVSEFC